MTGKETVNKWLESIQDCFFPHSCLLCGGAGAGGLDLCSACRSELPHNRWACSRCGIPLAAGAEGCCGPCQRHPPQFAATLALFRYEEPVRMLLHDLKFRDQFAVARLFGELLAIAAAAREPRPQAIIPVPLHPRRFRQRGYNQSTEIARIAARRLGLPLDLRHCTRRRPTLPQTGMPAAERRRNLRHAFQVSAELDLGHVTIVDDIVTTGATVGELTRALRSAGVARVDVWAVARA